jgi:hypothetical protein
MSSDRFADQLVQERIKKEGNVRFVKKVSYA